MLTERPVHEGELIVVRRYKGEVPKIHRKQNGEKIVVRQGPILARVNDIVYKDGKGSRGRTIGTGYLCTFTDVVCGLPRSYYLEQADWEKAGWRIRLNNRIREMFVGLSDISRSLSKRFELT